MDLRGRQSLLRAHQRRRQICIPEVPAGTYKLVVAHPFTGPVEQSVTIAAGKPSDPNIELKK